MFNLIRGPAPPGLDPASLRLNRWQAVAGAVAMNMVGPFISIFAIRLGASNAQLGSLASLPNLLSVPAILAGGWLLSRAPNKKPGVALAFLLARLLWLAVAAVPWVPPGARVAALLVAWALAVAPQAAANTGLNALLADMFPGEQRGIAFAARNSAATAAGMLAGLLAGVLLDRLAYPGGYQAMFSAAAAVGLLEVWLLWQFRERGARAPAPAAAGPPGAPQAGDAPVATGARAPAGGWRRAFAHRPYLRFTVASMIFHFAWMMVWPLFSRYQVTTLGANNAWMSVLTLANAATQTLSYPTWARLAERYGNRPMLALATFGLALLPGLTAASPDLWWLIPVNLLGGVATAGVMLLVMNSLLDVAPAGERPLYLAVNQALVAAMATVAPLVGGYLMDVLPIRGALALSTALRLGLGVGTWLLLDRLETGRRQEMPHWAAKP